jgi:hypothetical protein
MNEQSRDPGVDAEGKAYDPEMTEPDEANAPDESETATERVAPDEADRAAPEAG